MSLIGNKPVSIPKGVEIALDDAAIVIKGKGGSLSVPNHPAVNVAQEDATIVVKPKNPATDRPMQGTIRQLIHNAIVGVTEGYQRALEVHGVGYTAAVQGQSLVLNVGFANKINIPIPQGLEVTTKPNQRDKNVTDIEIKGIDKQAVGQLAAVVRGTRPPEPYNLKGIRYRGERVVKKQGKATVG